MIASGKNWEEMRDIAKDFNKKKLKLIDLRISNGVIAGTKILNFLEEIFQGNSIENTAIPLKIMATNIDTLSLHVFCEGDIAKALRATMSVPTIFKAFEREGNRYIDGGVIANLPIEYASKKRVLAISIIHQNYRKEQTQKGRFHSETTYKTSASILQRSVNLMIQQNEKRSLLMTKKKILVFDVKHDFSMLDFDRCDEMIDFGYSEMQKLLG
ncbi:MAG: hypothetical protein GXP45_06740 [bacterium]|nr:hypothetical protein [bacterium]